MQSSIVDEIAFGSEKAGDSGTADLRGHDEFQTVENNLKVSIPTLEMETTPWVHAI